LFYRSPLLFTGSTKRLWRRCNGVRGPYLLDLLDLLDLLQPLHLLPERSSLDISEQYLWLGINNVIAGLTEHYTGTVWIMNERWRHTGQPERLLS
jgi:hypothetical protein